MSKWQTNLAVLFVVAQGFALATRAAAFDGKSATPAAGSAAAQDPNPDKRPEVADLIAKLEAHADKKGAEDTDAIAVIDQLSQEFQKSGPKDKAAILKALAKCFDARRLEVNGQPPNNKLYLAAAVALGQMGPESTKTLISAIGNKNLRKDIALQHRLILSLGKTHDKDAIKTLNENLENKDASLVSAAAEAFGEFSIADLDTRKNVFETLLKILMSAKGSMDTDAANPSFRERYDVIAAPIITSLGKLSKHEEREPEKWQTWWNKNKKADWDATK